MTFQEWHSKGQYYKVLGHQVFVIDQGQSDQTLVILHGFPTCSYDFWKILPLLSNHFRVIIHDHLGFGLSDKPKDYDYSLVNQTDIALGVWKALGIKSAHILAHDYGTSIATELIARRNEGDEPVKLLSATIGNGSMLIHMAKLRLIQKLLRNKIFGYAVAQFTNRRIFNYNMKKLWADIEKVNINDFDVLWKMLEFKNAFAIFHKVSRYTHERAERWDRWIGGLEKTDLFINLLWADKDPVAVIEMANTLQEKIPHNDLKVLNDIGHYPMLEAPKLYGQSVIKMIKKIK